MAKKKSGQADEEDLERDTEDSDDEGADKENVDDDEEDGDDDDADDDDKDDGDEPDVRSNLSHIIARKNRKIKKLQEREQDEEEDDDEDADEKTERRVTKMAKDILAPMARDLDRKQIDIDISTFLADPRNAKFRKYEKKARRWAAHPSRAQLPVSSIFKEIAFDDFAADSEDDTNDRKDRAARNTARGNSFRSAPKSDVEKVQKMNFQSKEFQTLRQRVGAGETVNLEEEE